MSMQVHHTLMSQYKHDRASGIGSVIYESVANCVTPEVVIYGKCEQASYSGKNLFDGKLLVGYFEDTNGGVIAAAKFRSFYIDLAAGTYTISFVGTAINIVRTLIDGVLKTVGVNDRAHYTFTTSGGYVGLSWKRSDDAAWDDSTLIQIEAGGSATAYEPYVGGVASPNPLYPQDIVANDNVYKCNGYGKNMFHSLNDADVTVTMYGLTVSYNASTGIIRVYGTVEGVSHLTSTAYVQYEILKQNSERIFDNGYATLYAEILSNDVFEISSPFYIAAHTPTKINRLPYHIRENLTPSYYLFTTDDYACGFNVSIPLQSIDEGKRVDFSFRPIFVEGRHAISDFATGTIITPELYSVDNVYQVGDVRDEYYPQTGKIVRRCAKMTLSSSIVWNNATTDTRGICFQFTPDNVVKGNRTSICSHFKNVMGTWGASNKGNTGEYSDNDLTGIKYFRPPNDSIDTLDKFKAWLDEQKAAGTPVTLVYVLAEPVIEYVEPVVLTSVRGTNVIEESPSSDNIMWGDPYVTGTQIDVKYLTHS